MRPITIPLLLLLALPAAMTAQTQAEPEPAPAPTAAPAVRYGYIGYRQALEALPDYGMAQKKIDAIRAKYDEEADRAARDFNEKYEDFLEQMNQLPQSILRKRQIELQEMMQKNIAFKEESRRLLQKAEDDILAPLKAQLNLRLEMIGRERGWMFILNTDETCTLWLNADNAEDALPLLRRYGD